MEPSPSDSTAGTDHRRGNSEMVSSMISVIDDQCTTEYRGSLCGLFTENVEYSLSRCSIQFGRWRSWFSTLPCFLFFRWSRLHWFLTAGWGFSWSSAVVFLCFSRPQFSQWLRCSQVHAFSWYVPGKSFAPLWFCSSISSLVEYTWTYLVEIFFSKTYNN